MLVNMKADFKTGLKICSRCKRELPLSCFSKSKGRSDGLEHNCKECRSVLIKLYRNTERRNQKMKVKENEEKIEIEDMYEFYVSSVSQNNTLKSLSDLIHLEFYVLHIVYCVLFNFLK